MRSMHGGLWWEVGQVPTDTKNVLRHKYNMGHTQSFSKYLLIGCGRAMEPGAGLVGEIQMNMFFKHILINV